MYSKKDLSRLLRESSSQSTPNFYRTPFRVDYSRLIHSPSFRRLQGKTQLFPARENDFFRNRLTHSIEVAQIAKTIALKINHKYRRRVKNRIEIDTDLVEFAALAHDLGHPPFGHQGEEALDSMMVNFGGFEGNAQTLRLLVKIEKKFFDETITSLDKRRCGLNLTSRAIASILKYDNVIPFSKADRESYATINKQKVEPIKGYYKSENDIVTQIKKYVLGKIEPDFKQFKTLECHIMDVADDIAYSTYDLEDTLKARFSNPFDILFPNTDLLNKISKIVSDKTKRNVSCEIVSDIFYSLFENQFPHFKKTNSSAAETEQLVRFSSSMAYQNSINLSNDGYLRTEFTSNLVNNFVEGVEFYEDSKYSALSKVDLDSQTRLVVEVLKCFNFEVNIMSPRLKIAAYRGKEIINKIFETLIRDDGFLLMPDDYRELYESCVDEKDRYRTVCDFIAGMTDTYCIEFYGRLTSENPETIFKPF